MLNDRPTAFDYLQKALQISPSKGEVLFRAAIVYNHFDQTEQALASLKKAVDAGYSRAIVRGTPDFQNLQQNQQFQSLAQIPEPTRYFMIRPLVPTRQALPPIVIEV